MKENVLNIKIPGDKIKCLQCKFGLIVDPYRTKCGKYKQGKPDEIYYENKDCPYFEKAILEGEEE